MKRRLAATDSTPIFDIVYDQRTCMDNSTISEPVLQRLASMTEEVAFSHEPATKMNQRYLIRFRDWSQP
jgi:hypothetical protein